MLAVNGAISAATGKSPHQLVYRQDVALLVDHVLDVQQSNVSAENAAARTVEWTQLARRAVEKTGL